MSGKVNPLGINKKIAIGLLTIGLILVAVSLFYSSSVYAIVGLCLTFWGAILLYITPTRYVPAEFLIAAATSNLSDTEKLLNESKIEGNGIYLSPKYFGTAKNIILAQQKPSGTLPKPDQVDLDKLHLAAYDSILLTPPGLVLSSIFERELKVSLLSKDLCYLQEQLPKLLKELGIAEEVEMEASGKTVTFYIKNNVFEDICTETRHFNLVHKTTGCLLSSAIACTLTKVTGKSITIDDEIVQPHEKITKIRYQILEDE